MQVLQIAHCYYPPFLDCARQYAALFKGTDVRVTTVYLTGEQNAEVESASESDEVIFLGYESKDVSGLKLGAIRKIRKLASKRHFSFCIAHRAKPTYVALLATSLPVISVRHNFGDFDRLSRRLLVNLFRKRIVLLGVSNAVRDEMRRALPLWSASRIQTLYNRIDIHALQRSLLTRNEARKRLGLPQNAWIVATVGRLHHDKDQATLLKGFAKALPHLPESSLLVIIGKGTLANELQELAYRLGIAEHTIFTGSVTGARQYFKAFDVFALTSDHEPFGMVLLEAMAAELPLICSDCGGGAEIVNGTGHLFPLGDAGALALAIIATSKEIKADANLGKRILMDKFSDEAARVSFKQITNTSNFLKI